MGQFAVELVRLLGRNGWDSPLDVAPDMCVEARNWHWYTGALGQKRAGSTAQTLTGDTHSGYNALFRYVPGQDDTAAELFIISSDATPKMLRVAAGTSKSNLTLMDNIASRAWDVSAAFLNGKLYLAYDTTVNRLHVFDSSYSTTAVRRAGVGTPAAPTGADMGAGALSFSRSYKVAFVAQRSSVTYRRSELSPVLTRTIASKLGSTITKPASLGEDESHWELWASDTATGTYYRLAVTAVATTTYDDTNATIPTTTAEPTAGTYTPFPSVKYLATDGNRLLGYGVWETSAGDSLSPKNGRVYYGPVLDSTTTDDDERISNTTTLTGYIDITRNASSIDRGISPRPLNGNFYVFQDRGITMLVPTQDPDDPFARVVLSSQLGAVNHHSIVMAEDELGRPCCYFLDPELGPYRVGPSGLQRIGKDVQDIWDTVNLSATGQVAWSVYYKSLNLVIFAVATGSSNDPDKMLVFDVTNGRPGEAGDGIRGGWCVWDGDFASGRCGVMFAASMGASMGRKLVPFVGVNSGTKLLRYDTTKTQDDSTNFRGYITSRAFTGPLWAKGKRVLRSYLLAGASSGVTITQSWTRNFGDETARTDTALLTAAGSEADVIRRYEAPDLQDADVFQVTLGDASAAATAFTLERWWAQVEEQELL